jgi:hypothetical protein
LNEVKEWMMEAAMEIAGEDLNADWVAEIIAAHAPAEGKPTKLEVPIRPRPYEIGEAERRQYPEHARMVDEMMAKEAGEAAVPTCGCCSEMLKELVEFTKCPPDEDVVEHAKKLLATPAPFLHEVVAPTRERFEVWAVVNGLDLQLENGSQIYREEETQNAYDAWLTDYEAGRKEGWESGKTAAVGTLRGQMAGHEDRWIDSVPQADVDMHRVPKKNPPPPFYSKGVGAFLNPDPVPQADGDCPNPDVCGCVRELPPPVVPPEVWAALKESEERAERASGTPTWIGEVDGKKYSGLGERVSSQFANPEWIAKQESGDLSHLPEGSH